MGTIPLAILTDASNNVGIGAAPSGSYKLEVTGTAKVSSTLLLGGALTGAAATFSGTLTANGTIQQNSSQDLGTSAYFSANVTNGFRVLNAANTIGLLSITNAGAATFSSSVTAGDQIKVTGSGAYLSIYDTQASSKNWAIRAGHDAVGDLAIRQSNSTGGDPISAGTNRLYFSSTGAATFSTSITIGTSGYAGNELQMGNGSTDFAIDLAGSGKTDVYNSGTLTFNTALTERMRITQIASGGYTKITNNGSYVNSSGNYHEIYTNRNNENVVYITNVAASPYGPFLYFSNAAPNNTTNYFLQCVDSSVVCFTIWSNGTTSGRSDIRLKKNIANATPKLDNLMKLRIVNYEWKESIEGGKELGLIAQEVEEVFPNLVITEPIKKKREIEQEDGTIIEEEYEEGDYKSIKNSVLPYITIKAVQELKIEKDAEILELKKQIEELNERLNKAGL